MASTALAHLTFRMGEEDYALPLDRIAQTVSDDHITPLPTAPPFLKGLVSVGGTAVPVVDLSLRFGGGRGQHAAAHRSVLAVRVRIRGRATLMGLLIDRLGRVVRVSPEQIQPPSAVDALLPREFLDGIVEWDGRFVLLMDVDRVLDADESAAVSELAGELETVAPETRREQVPYLAVRVAGERCVLRLARLRETLSIRRITRVPGAPPDILGATNVRGAIVPVIDLARRFRLGVTRQEKESRLVLLQPDDQASTVAFLADAIEGLTHISPGDIDRVPPFGTRFPADLVEGMAPFEGGFVPVLDGERALSVTAPVGAASTEG